MGSGRGGLRDGTKKVTDRVKHLIFASVLEHPEMRAEDRREFVLQHSGVEVSKTTVNEVLRSHSFTIQRATFSPNPRNS